MQKNCQSSGCKKCQKKHNTLLHFNTTNDKSNNEVTDSSPVNDQAITETTPVQNPDTNQVAATTQFQVNHVHNQVLLSTVSVYIKDKIGQLHTVRVLLDNGSQSNFITESLCDKLGLEKIQYKFAISGVGQSVTNIKFKTNFTIYSRFNKGSYKVTALVIQKITDNLSAISFDASCFNIPSHINLADPSFNINSPIDMLLGADIFWDLLSVGQIKLNLLLLQKTKLGWIASGSLTIPLESSFSGIVSNVCEQDYLTNQITKFWEIEDCSSSKRSTDSQSFCEIHFQENTYRTETGRFVVSIPFRDDINKLGNSEEFAL